MTPEALDQLADAVSRTLSAHVGDRCGYVLILVDTAEAGEIMYRSDLERLGVAGILDDCAEYLRGTVEPDNLTD